MSPKSRSNSRDYDQELEDTTRSKYAYGFDLDVMHPLMMRAFSPHFVGSSVLELGSSNGDFTEHLLGRFSSVTCVEASRAAADALASRFDSRVTIQTGVFEEVGIEAKFDNVILTHVLEHLDDPQVTLRRVKEEWLEVGGRVFVACPNANAPSRQLAVRMGLLPHAEAVSESELAHGHRRTYSLDTLEQEVLRSGLTPIAVSGIFFKALANFQWDELLAGELISPAFLDASFELGRKYPDLCASTYVVSE